MEGLFGGHLIGVKGEEWVCFYDWESGALIRRIDEVPKNVRPFVYRVNGRFTGVMQANFSVLRPMTPFTS